MKFSNFFLVFILSFILFFSTSVSCYASDSDKLDATGFNSWSLDEKVQYVGLNIVDFFTSFTGLLNGDTTEYRKWLLDYYARYPEAGVDNFYEYVANGLSFDDDTQTWELSDYLVEFCNSIVVDYNDRVTMTYRYPTPVQCISAENFPNNTIYQALIKTCMAYPNSYVLTSNSYQGAIQNGVYMALDGSVGSCYFPDAYWWYVIPEPFAGVSQYLDLASVSTTFYNDNWEDCFIPRKFYFTPDGRAFYQVNEELAGYAGYLAEFDIDNFPLLDDVDKGIDWVSCGTSYATFLDNSYSASLSARTVYSASPNALNVYKSVADMKKDIGSQVIGSYTDTYTGTPVQTITQSEINNIVNNYYPSDPDDDPGGGSSSGSDDSGGSSSGGSGIIDGLGKLFGAIGNIIDKLFGFVLGLLSKVVDFFGSILEMFTDTLTKLIDIVPAGFNQFLAAMFSYIPEEWITIAEFILLVSAIGCVVALFKK